MLRGITQLIYRQIENANQEVGRFIINVQPLLFEQRVPELIEMQKIVLVGGFSQSPYLRERISKAFAVDGKLAILTPADPYVSARSPTGKEADRITGKQWSCAAQQFGDLEGPSPPRENAETITASSVLFGSRVPGRSQGLPPGSLPR